MEKLVKAAKTIDKVLSALRGVIIAVSATALLALVIGIAFSGSITDAAGARLGDSVSLTGLTGGLSLKIWMTDPVLSAGSLRGLFASLIGIVAAILALSLYAIRQLKEIMRETKEGRPFSEAMPGRIRKIAYVVFAYAVMTPAIPLLPLYFAYRLLDIQSILLSSPYIGRVETDFSVGVNILAVAAGVILLFLSFVFEYGARLQRESDETL